MSSSAYLIFCTIYFSLLGVMGVVLFKQKKLFDKLISELEEAYESEYKLLETKKNLMEIILLGKKNKENYFETLDKLEKELFE